MEQSNHNNHNNKMEYKRLLLMIIVMFVAMFFIMYSMIDSINELVLNINNVYMTLLMTTAMIIIELLIMKNMYPNKKINTIILASSVGLMVFSWFGIRYQIGVGNKEFLKGMIPHHSAALLMSGKANITDPELFELRDSILSTQRKEIDFMEKKLKEKNK